MACTVFDTACQADPNPSPHHSLKTFGARPLHPHDLNLLISEHWIQLLNLSISFPNDRYRKFRRIQWFEVVVLPQRSQMLDSWRQFANHSFESVRRPADVQQAQVQLPMQAATTFSFFPKLCCCVKKEGSTQPKKCSALLCSRSSIENPHIFQLKFIRIKVIQVTVQLF